MKSLIICFLLFTTGFSSFAQSSEKYNMVMQKNIYMIDSSFKMPEIILQLANSFERIGNAEKKEWLPYYYAAFLHVNYGFMQKDKSGVDVIADKAEELINKADSLSPHNSEISCIKSMIFSCRLMVDPQSRYMKFGANSSAMIEQAIKENPENPRPLFLKAQSLKYTPEQFGGGCKNALPVMEKAAEKFMAFKPLTTLDPDWGKEIIMQLIADCKK